MSGKPFYCAAFLAVAAVAAPARAGELAELITDIRAHTDAATPHLQQWQYDMHYGSTKDACEELEAARVEMEAGYNDLNAMRDYVENGGELEEGTSYQATMDFINTEDANDREIGANMADYYNNNCANLD